MLKIGLQYFAEESAPAANAGAVNVAAPEGPATPETPAPQADAAPAESTSAPETPAADPKTEKPPEKPPEETETQRFSKRLNAKIAQERDALVKEIYGSQGITTYQQYLDAKAAQDAAQKAKENNVPVEFYNQLTQAQQKADEALQRLSAYERKDAIAKEAEALAKDPKWGEFFKANETEIRELAERANTTLDTAKLLVLDKKGFEKPDVEKIAQEAVKKYLDGLRAGNKPVEGAGPVPAVVQSSPKTFEEARQGALAMLRAQRQT